MTRDGKFYAGGLMGSGGTLIADVPCGQWYNVSIDFGLGDAAAKQYALTLSIPGKQKVKTTLPFGHSTFRNATWFGISSTSDERAIFYVDNLILGAAAGEDRQGGRFAEHQRPGRTRAEGQTRTHGPQYAGRLLEVRRERQQSGG